MARSLLIIVIIFLFAGILRAQNDTIVSYTGDVLVGEVKSMERAVLVFKTKYSDKDFNIEWDEITKINSNRDYLIYLDDGRRINGRVTSLEGNSSVVMITHLTGNLFIDSLLKIIYLKPLEKSFLSRLDASVELGYSFTKAKNHHQFNARSSVGYLADTWGTDASFDMIRSAQDSVAATKRTDGTVGARLLFNKSWFLQLSNNFLQNDEQKLRLRSTTNLQAGHLIVNTYRLYWSVATGAAFNYESFTNEQPDEQSLEGLLSTELNLFAFDDLSLLTNLKFYPSFTVKGRIRSDFRFDLKYDFLDDFFIKIGFTYNFDSKPVAGATRLDYVIQTTLGWEL